MALSKRARIALMMGGTAAAVIGTGAVYLSRTRKEQAALPEGEADEGTQALPEAEVDPAVGMVPIEAVKITKDEPLGGWEARWDVRKNQAFNEMRGAPGVDSWSKAVQFALDVAYPETAPRYSKEQWPQWLRDAQNLVRQDLAAQSPTGGGWKFQIWLMFDRIMPECAAALAPHIDGMTHCAASMMFPGVDWPPNQNAPWQVEFWDTLNAKVTQWWNTTGTFDAPGGDGDGDGGTVIEFMPRL